MTKQLRTIFPIFLLSVLLTACDTDSLALFNSTAPSVDQRFKMSRQYFSEQGKYPEIDVSDDKYNVYVCSDPHVDYFNNTLTQFVDTFRNDKDAHIAICLGDLVEANQSYVWFQKPFEYMQSQRGKSDTLFVALGNHDIFYDQYQEFIDRWKNTCYCFSVHCRKGNIRDLYICMDTAEGTLGRLQMDWLRNTLKDAVGHYRYIIVYTHVNLFRTDNTYADISTVSLEETYELMSLFTRYGVKQFWAGHDHARDQFAQGGVQYIMLDSMTEEDEHPSYMLHVSPEKLENTFQEIKRQ